MSMPRTIRALWGATLVGAALLGASGCDPAGGAATKPPANQVSTSPAATTPPAAGAQAANLSITATQIVTQGSVGTPPGSLTVTVHNGGSAVTGATVTFRIPTAMALDGPAWAACRATTSGSTSTVDCPTGPLAADQSMAVTYGFRVRLGLRDAGTVSVAAIGAAPEATPADNTAELHVCTNGCGG